MRERMKMFTHISGEGSTVSDTELENLVNEWLASVDGKIVAITQTESQRSTKGQHITLCVWYRPTDEASS